jgi:type 2 lantibiotic biosynthesis protein LanM
MNSHDSLFLETADRIGARLCRDALWAGRRCNWLGGYSDIPGTVVHRALGPAIYDGTSGIALFLARLFGATQEKIFRITAEGAVRHALSRTGDVRADFQISFYFGLAGIVYAALEAGEITGSQEWLGQTRAMAASLAGGEVGSAPLDVMGGSAGAIAALLYLHNRYREDEFLEAAMRHGERLLAAARRSESGWSWRTLETEHTGERPDLTGFSHGAAGISWSLLELFRATGEERFRQAAEQGFRYERSCFSAEHGNWPDFRALDGGRPEYPSAWCHGAPGIGLSRLRAWQILKEGLYREESKIALGTTMAALRDASQGNYSLCHGHAGNAEVLLYASQVLEGPDYRAAAERVAMQGIERYEDERIPWPCGSPDEAETPDLMLGLAGIGYFYLRLYAPAGNPGVLMPTG